MRHDLKRWLPLALWAALIFALSSVPDLTSGTFLFKHSDKLAHLALYLPLGWLLARAFHVEPAPSDRSRALWVGVIGALYGLSDEWHQAFVPGRHPDFWDWLVDSLAVALGIWLYRRYQSRSEMGAK